MANDNTIYLHGQILDEHTHLTYTELCRASALEDEQVTALVLEGVIEPIERDAATDADPTHWQFCGVALQRAVVARRLTRDLEVNLAGVALAFELMDQIADLKSRLGRCSKA
ncbi:MAG: chaperone modulator CbpM [Rhodocyclaceae bacterium]|nr:chaperone modulator CbpM [Rhodocyclaceae bacterium]